MNKFLPADYQNIDDTPDKEPPDYEPDDPTNENP